MKAAGHVCWVHVRFVACTLRMQVIVKVNRVTYHSSVVFDAERRLVSLVCAFVVFVRGEGAMEASYETFVCRLRGAGLFFQHLQQPHRTTRPVALAE